MDSDPRRNILFLTKKILISGIVGKERGRGLMPFLLDFITVFFDHHL